MKNFHFIQTILYSSGAQKSWTAIEKGSKGKFPIIKASTSYSHFPLRSRKLFLMRKWF